MRAAAAAVAALPLLARGAPVGYDPISVGSVCSRSQAVNVIPRLPRYTLLAQPVSSDVGSYRLFDCAGANSSRACSVHTGFLDALSGVGSSPASVSAALGSAAVRGTVVDYVQASCGGGVRAWRGGATSWWPALQPAARPAGDGRRAVWATTAARPPLRAHRCAHPPGVARAGMRASTGPSCCIP